MSQEDRSAARSRLVSIALVASLALIALVFRRQLVAWFSGASMTGSGGSMGDGQPRGRGAPRRTRWLARSTTTPARCIRP